MDRNEVKDRIQAIFCDILDNEDIRIIEASTASDIEGWDSLTHIQLVVAVEKAFRIRFNSREILSWKNIGEMIDSIMSKN